MKLMKKIALIFISVTMISSIAFFSLGNKIIKEVSRGELERGPGRTNGALSKVNGEVNQITSQAREFGEYFSISSAIESKYGSEERDEIIKIKKKIEKTPITNMVMVDEDFNIIEKIKISNLDVKSDDTKIVLEEAKKLINSKENIKKGFFGGLISTDKMLYIVGVKRVTIDENTNRYTVVINPMDATYIQYLDELTGRKIELAKEDEVIELMDELIMRDDLYNATFYCLPKTDSIDIYTEFDVLGNGPKYFIKLTDDREVKNNATVNIYILIVSIVGLTILANIIVYILIKKKALNRVININKVVNKVSEGTDLEVELKDDDKGDEISVLTSDLNNMFKRLKVYSDNLEYIGNHDLLTTLINRNRLSKYTDELIKSNESFAMLFIDLDNFKGINDTLGHKVGDELLCLVATELIKFSEDDNIKISRIGGDEFVVIRKGENDKEKIAELANNILNRVHHMYELNKYSYEVKASMGISFYPEDAEDEVTLLQYSDVAMYCSKNLGGNVYKFFEKSMLEPLEIESKLKSAIENREFKVYYQPIYNVESRKIIGAEALVRWIDNNEVILPEKFIPIGKKTGDIAEIDNFVLGEAIKTCRNWLDKSEKDFYISVNASKRFLNQRNIVNFIEEELKKNNVDPSCLKLEITEDEIIDDIEYTINLLNQIKKIGVKVSLDDFGMGYSSFNHIKILPVDVVKIDKSLVTDIEGNHKDKAIVETMIELCHSLNLKVICEGVEDASQVEILEGLNCDSIQGYYFSKPITKEEFDKLYDKE